MEILVIVFLMFGLYYVFYRMLSKFIDNKIKFLKEDLQEKLRDMS